MKSAQDYLAEKLQEAEESLRSDSLQKVYWMRKYFALLKTLGNMDAKEEIRKAVESNFMYLE